MEKTAGSVFSGTFSATPMSNPAEREVTRRMAEEDTDRLVRRCQKGDADAFDALVGVYERKMYNLAYRMAGNHHDATELAQEIFIRLHRSIRKFKWRSKFSTWFYRLAMNVCCSGLRRRRRIASVEVYSIDDERDSEEGTWRNDPADEGPRPDEEVVGQEVLEQVQAVIASMPEDFRTVLVLRDINGMVYEEMAEVLGCSLGTVKSRLARARTRARELLKSQGLICSAKTS
jgi:RNA polymerase sigma-70 factor (ECF subfamily)